MNTRPVSIHRGRVLAGLALLLFATGCESGSETRGPAPADQGEEAALADAAAMLDAREPEGTALADPEGDTEEGAEDGPGME